MAHDKRFSGKVVIVTGAGHGIGRAVAERFGSEGARVVVNDVDRPNADAVVESIRAAGAEAMTVIADVSSKTQVDTVFDLSLERFGTVDVLVNNAGLIAMGRHFLGADEVWWDRVLGVNLKGL